MDKQTDLKQKYKKWALEYDLPEEYVKLAKDSDWLKTLDRDIARMNVKKVGCPYRYPDSIIEFGLMIREDLGVSYRKLYGILALILEECGVDNCISYSQFYERSSKMAKDKN